MASRSWQKMLINILFYCKLVNELFLIKNVSCANLHSLWNRRITMSTIGICLGVIWNILMFFSPHLVWLILSILIACLIAYVIVQIIIFFIKIKKTETLKAISLSFVIVFSLTILFGGYYLNNELQKPYSTVSIFLRQPCL